MSNTDGFDYSAQMGYSHLELTRNLTRAVTPYQVSEDAGAGPGERRFNLTLDDRTARLIVGEEKVRRIAALKLPVVDVKIEFENFSQTERDQFLERFKKYLHRGGG